MNMKDIIIDKLKRIHHLLLWKLMIYFLNSIEEYQSLENTLDSLVSDGYYITIVRKK